MATQVYWTDRGNNDQDKPDPSVNRIMTDGTGQEVITDYKVRSPHRVFLDLANDHIYFSWNQGIKRATLSAPDDAVDLVRFDGSGAQGDFNVFDLEIDLTNDKMYLIESANEPGTIFKIDNIEIPTGKTAVTRTEAGGDVSVLLTTVFSTDSRDLKLHEASGTLYFADKGNDRILKVNTDGTGSGIVLSSGITSMRGLAIDTVSGHLFFGDTSLNTIKRCDLDGSNLTTLITDASALASPHDIALDIGNAKMYWTELISGTIYSANMDGTSVAAVSGPNDNFRLSRGLHVDTVNGKLYISNAANRNDVRTMTTSGTNLTTLVRGHVFQPEQVKLDSASGLIFYADSDTNSIHRMDTDGGNHVEIVPRGSGLETEDAFFGFPNITTYQWAGLALDKDNAEFYTCDFTHQEIHKFAYTGNSGEPSGTKVIGSGLMGVFPLRIFYDETNDKIYWTEFTPGTVRRANRVVPSGKTADNRTDIETLVTGMTQARGVAVDPAANKVFFTSASGLNSMTLSSGSLQNLVSTSDVLTDLDVDTVDQKVYMSNRTDGKVQRCQYDGTGLEDVATGGTAPMGVTVVDQADGQSCLPCKGFEVFYHKLDNTTEFLATNNWTNTQAGFVGGQVGNSMAVAGNNTNCNLTSSFNYTNLTGNNRITLFLWVLNPFVAGGNPPFSIGAPAEIKITRDVTIYIRRSRIDLMDSGNKKARWTTSSVFHNHTILNNGNWNLYVLDFSRSDGASTSIGNSNSSSSKWTLRAAVNNLGWTSYGQGKGGNQPHPPTIAAVDAKIEILQRPTSKRSPRIDEVMLCFAPNPTDFGSVFGTFPSEGYTISSSTLSTLYQMGLAGIPMSEFCNRTPLVKGGKRGLGSALAANTSFLPPSLRPGRGISTPSSTPRSDDTRDEG